ncbi:2'-5' RNA ligase family protein [Mycobacterium sp. M1]|uniref:2'-5' RNA ligase family protein n=1 Tax=Mycolicibacter acidiphilus TaxID=2835306 RepID=A0ABS5RL39_9MYCO|nr:2'-5' RNA ligase family protein [Mycolicibacter acidiphilus]MBS9534308.1 2'-5' RNA ligase family protein [Mycolicibacter acidiphilus]
MVHSIELVFDADTEAAIRRIWAGLAGAGVPSQAPAARPHVTLVVAQRIDPQVEEVLTGVVADPPACTLGPPVLFGKGGTVLARLVVPSADLLAVHAEVYRLSLPHLVPHPLPHTAPGQWTPHVTCARHVGPAHLARAARITGRPSEIQGRFAGLRRWQGDTRTEHPIS